MSIPTEADTTDPVDLASAAAEIYGMRRARDQVISQALVGEPAWDILLALYAEHPGKLTMTSLSHSFAVPASTALRWIAALERQALVERTVQHLGDATLLLALTEEGCRTMERCMKSMLRAARE